MKTITSAESFSTIDIGRFYAILHSEYHLEDMIKISFMQKSSKGQI